MTNLYKSKVTGAIYTYGGEYNSSRKTGPDVLLNLGNEVVHCPKKNLLKCFDLVVEPEPYYVPITVNVIESKFEAVFGDQSLFDLVGATDEYLYIVRNAKHTGIYAATQAQWDKHNYLNKVLAERKVKEPEFIPYHTEDYPHEDCKGGVMAFRSRSGEAAINFEDDGVRGEVVLSFENTVRFANELLAIANGVERKE